MVKILIENFILHFTNKIENFKRKASAGGFILAMATGFIWNGSDI